MTSDVQWQNYLSDATDAMWMNESLEPIRSRYGIQYRDDKDLIDLIAQLNSGLSSLEPSSHFSSQLKDDLMGVERAGVVWRIRRLPARVQWAAIVTAILGGVLIVWQWFTNAGDTLRPEERTTIPEES